ncbi:MAG: transcription termination/antitermination protein NusA [Anaerolineales bacterium]|nr:transcription termination/antitermination protein NusA [Anaerolineales bacterium]
MKSDFALAFNEILEARSLPREVVIEAIQQALVSAYRRDASLGSSQQRIEAAIDANGATQILLEKEVVDDVVDNRTEVPLTQAIKLYPDCQMGDMVMMPVETTSSNFGRIAAQTAKQVILQRIREAERETLYEEFIERQGDLITGTVQSTSAAGVTLNLLGRAEAVMPRQHQMPNERFRPHDKVRVYVVDVNRSTRGPQIIVSRSHKDMLRRLLEYEVPEIYNGQVEIKNIAREAGYRSKVAVYAEQETIDPVGACVGIRGMRIQNIIKELNDEKIDVIEWDANPAKFIAKALSPARVSGVFLHDELDQMRTATVVVPEDQLSLAIGREGQNARLAAKLTGWRIDIKSITETSYEDFAGLEYDPLSEVKYLHPELVEEVGRILEKKRSGRPVMPEEYSTLVQFVTLTQSTKVHHSDKMRAERMARLEAIRPMIPDAAFHMPLARLELAEDIIKALGRIDNVGDLMIRVLSDEEYLAATLAANKAAPDALEAIKYALDDLVLPEILNEEEDETSDIQEVEMVAEVEPVAVEPEELIDGDSAESAEVLEPLEQVVTVDEVPPAFPELDMEAELQVDEADVARRQPTLEEWDESIPAKDEDDDEDKRGKRGKKPAKKQRVELVYDEDLGEMIAKRRRKGNRRRNDFYDFDDEI